MASQLDPGGTEPEALLEAVDLLDARVLEIGCGDGRLTFRDAEVPRFSVGIDPSVQAIGQAVGARRRDLSRRVGFVAASALTLPFRDRSFDIALLAWSL